MTSIESTPEMAVAIYRAMERRLESVRRRLRRPLTLAEKVLLGHLDDPERQELAPGQELPAAASGSGGLPGSARADGDPAVHAERAGARGRADEHPLRPSDPGAPRRARGPRRRRSAENAEVYEFLRRAAAKYHAGFWGPGAGIMHQVVLENYAFPGELIIGTDSHTPNAGGLGACAVGVGGADAVEAVAGLPWELLYPRRIAVHLTGRLNGWTAPKDVDRRRRRRADRRRRHERDRRIHRAGCAHAQRDRQGHHRQHGRRDRRDDLDVPGR